MRIWYCMIYIWAAAALSEATNFTQCLLEVRSGAYGPEGALDNRGNPVANIQDATAISYTLCLKACGKGQATFSWSVFLPRVGAWLFPWLALACQLPYGSNDNFDNLQSMLLCIGSPALAAYSIILTTLNGRWIARRFLPMHEHPNAYSIVRVFSALQQAPLRITDDHHLLAYLVRSPGKEKWWKEMRRWLAMTHSSWSISAAISIGWVAIAYAFTVLDSIPGEIGGPAGPGNNGQQVGTLWLWLLPIVVTGLQLSPRCDIHHLSGALGRANKLAFGDGMAAEGADAESDIVPIDILLESSVQRDECRSPPVFNYSRIFTWSQMAETVAQVLSIPESTSLCANTTASSLEASTQSDPTDALKERPYQGCPQTPPEQLDTEDRCTQNVGDWVPGVWGRMFIAGCLALWLQWGTTAAAAISIWFSPTIGLGCRSASYLAYGGLSTLSWLTITLSSVLAHYASSSTRRHSRQRTSVWAAELFAISLRRTGKVVAAANAVGLVIISIFQFSNFFANCYCNGSVMWWGTQRAFITIQLQSRDIVGMVKAWIGGEVLAASAAIGFLLAVKLFINPHFPRQDL